MADKPLPMADDDLITILRKEEQAAALYQTGALSKTRDDALSYYDRQPYGNEQEGASAVVTSEFADVIESMMPGLMRVFAGTDDVAEFTPGKKGQEQAASEASNYVRHVLMVQNDGFRILYWQIKDALMYRLGAVTVDLEDCDDVRAVPVQGLPQDAINMVLAKAAEQGAEVEAELTQDDDPAAGAAIPMPNGLSPANTIQAFTATFSGTITVTQKRKRVMVDNIAPEDILFSPIARDQDKASFLGFRKKVTASDLVLLLTSAGEGMSNEDAMAIVEDLRSDREISPEEMQRQDGAILEDVARDQPSDSERTLWIVVGYVRVDMDGDGISELMRVVYAHSGGTLSRIIDKMEWEGPASIALASPILMSHTIVGRSIFDQVQDLQQVGSAITRGMLDNLNFSIRPRGVIDDQVILETFLDWVPGSPVHLKAGAKIAEGHVDWLQVPSILDKALMALEHFQTVRENRTGIVRNNQGLEADTLNKTASGMQMLAGMAQTRMELVARVLGEAIKRLYRLIYRACKQAAKGPVDYWTGKSFETVDPTKWPDDMDLSMNIGAGSRDQAMAALLSIEQTMEKLVALQGGQAMGPFVTRTNVATLAERMSETLGYRTPGLFFQTPEEVEKAPPPQPQQDPLMAKVQAEAQAAQMKQQADMQLAQQKLEADSAHKQQQQVIDIQLATQKHQGELAAMREKAALELQLKRDAAAEDAKLARDKAEADAQLAEWEAEREFELEKMKIENMPKPGNTQLKQQTVEGSA